MESLKNHVFICTNEKDSGSCCQSEGAKELRTALKQRFQEKYGKKVRINAAGCLGQCSHGIACVIYPEGKWLLGLSSDVEEAFVKIDQIIRG